MDKNGERRRKKKGKGIYLRLYNFVSSSRIEIPRNNVYIRRSFRLVTHRGYVARLPPSLSPYYSSSKTAVTRLERYVLLLIAVQIADRKNDPLPVTQRGATRGGALRIKITIEVPSPHPPPFYRDAFIPNFLPILFLNRTTPSTVFRTILVPR